MTLEPHPRFQYCNHGTWSVSFWIGSRHPWDRVRGTEPWGQVHETSCSFLRI